MRLNELEGFDVKHFLTAKFTNKEWVQSFLEGNIYMNNFKHFIDQEKQSKVKGQGDSYEGAFVLEFTNVKIYDQNEMLVGSAKLGNIVERYDAINKIPMYCVANFSASNFIVLEQGEDYIRIKLDIPQEDISQIKEVFKADTVALSFSPHEFIRRFKRVAEETDMGLAYGMVDYEDYGVLDSVRRKSFDDGENNFLFTKHKSLSYQKEFRFILAEVETDVPIILKIGDLSDIFIQMDIDDFLSGTYIDLKYRS